MYGVCTESSPQPWCPDGHNNNRRNNNEDECWSRLNIWRVLFFFVFFFFFLFPFPFPWFSISFLLVSISHHLWFSGQFVMPVWYGKYSTIHTSHTPQHDCAKPPAPIGPWVINAWARWGKKNISILIFFFIFTMESDNIPKIWLHISLSGQLRSDLFHGVPDIRTIGVHSTYSRVGTE